MRTEFKWQVREKNRRWTTIICIWQMPFPTHGGITFSNLFLNVDKYENYFIE